jgi:hypothetical protein
MSELLATAADPGNDPGDALLLRVDSVGADLLSLASSVAAFCGHRVFRARAGGSRPSPEPAPHRGDPRPSAGSSIQPRSSRHRAVSGGAFHPSLRPPHLAGAGTCREVPAPRTSHPNLAAPSAGERGKLK